MAAVAATLNISISRDILVDCKIDESISLHVVSLAIRFC